MQRCLAKRLFFPPSSLCFPWCIFVWCLISMQWDAEIPLLDTLFLSACLDLCKQADATWRSGGCLFQMLYNFSPYCLMWRFNLLLYQGYSAMGLSSLSSSYSHQGKINTRGKHSLAAALNTCCSDIRDCLEAIFKTVGQPIQLNSESLF